MWVEEDEIPAACEEALAVRGFRWKTPALIWMVCIQRSVRIPRYPVSTFPPSFFRSGSNCYRRDSSKILSIASSARENTELSRSGYRATETAHRFLHHFSLSHYRHARGDSTARRSGLSFLDLCAARLGGFLATSRVVVEFYFVTEIKVLEDLYPNLGVVGNPSLSDLEGEKYGKVLIKAPVEKQSSKKKKGKKAVIADSSELEGAGEKVSKPIHEPSLSSFDEKEDCHQDVSVQAQLDSDNLVENVFTPKEK
ncbi:hypothetical protein KSP40_PGU004046 [Platanthera guangdongensis]|uniref:Uncharacterized protein n=1 Tax=Platanthera guangdongensis TaxID=2320717 RepID=A0ABR2LJ69_9ASPA